MGCDNEYKNAESFGLKDQQIGDQTADATQTTVLLFNTKPSTFDSSSMAYFDVPDVENLYLELGRITVVSDDETIGITDKDWEYLKNSFKFK